MVTFEYDRTNTKSIYLHACRLLNNSLHSIYGEIVLGSPRSKGDLGNLVEKLHFGIENNNNPEPDFVEVGLELKVTGIRYNEEGEPVAKERLALSMIDYKTLPLENWDTSSFVKKNMYLLILVYRYQKGEPVYTQQFVGAFTWRPSSRERALIMSDWITIRSKVAAGNAHLLSESDTQYLAANTKGANKNVVREQYIPFAPKAKPRSFSFKASFLTHLIRSNLDRQYQENTVHLYSDGASLEPLNSIEDTIAFRVKPFIGMTDKEICSVTGTTMTDAKSATRILLNAMLGFQPGQSIAEIEAAGIVIKTVTTTDSRLLKESMSFKRIDYHDICDEQWHPDDGPQAYFREVVTSRFLFVVFDRHGVSKIRTFKGVMPFCLPSDAEHEAHALWDDIRQCVLHSRYEELYSLKTQSYFHLRPKARNAADRIMTPTGVMAKKYAYWINRSVVFEALRTHGFV